jgi:hypothetical protein
LAFIGENVHSSKNRFSALLHDESFPVHTPTHSHTHPHTHTHTHTHEIKTGDKSCSSLTNAFFPHNMKRRDNLSKKNKTRPLTDRYVYGSERLKQAGHHEIE